MRPELISYKIKDFTTSSGVLLNELNLTYEVFGKPLHTAPIVVINHALTGNSDVLSEEKGWWKTIIGENKLIDTNKYTILAFNIPGNAYDDLIIENYKDFTTRDIASLFLEAIDGLKIEKLFAVIGGSLGGGIAWEMAVLKPKLIENLIPVACHWQSSDWIIGFNEVQMQILEFTDKPLEIARMMAMLFYRTPASLESKFNRSQTADGKLFNIESWLRHHGNKLNGRFEVSAYRLMTHLLTTLDITSHFENFEEAVKEIESNIIQVAVDTDWIFVKDETIETKNKLDKLEIKNEYHEIKSIHGHDAFLIEFEQLESFLKPIFK
ncbi:alpha/beta fold hydrolase [Lentimicrobium sp. L6]|uniref:alpha/beta fold hydrolase n=1 Tax=Lentimicrobium sp. L6 TaxID=2735916 RepID=UPI001554F3E0|nr:alpha/beta fold hydrolase [Lentimicrobium sp. L6]NPD85215.1 alpha/beta fold hydrolase [Lentimicrobium sp. L6]